VYWEGDDVSRAFGLKCLSDGIGEPASLERMETMDIGDLFSQDIDDDASRPEVEKRLWKVEDGKNSTLYIDGGSCQGDEG